MRRDDVTLTKPALVGLAVFLALAIVVSVYSILTSDSTDSVVLGVVSWLFLLGYPTSSLLEPLLAPLGIVGYLLAGSLQFALLGILVGWMLQRFRRGRTSTSDS